MNVQIDVLSDILNTIRLNGTVYFQLDFADRWGMQADPTRYKKFHIVVRGQCWLSGDFLEDPIPLYAGDILMFPNGDAHQLSAEPGIVCLSGQRILDAYQQGRPPFQQGTICTTLVCGHVEFRRELRHPFLNNLPPYVLVRSAERGDLDFLRTVTSMIIQETRLMRPGATVVVDRLAEVLHLYILRAYILEQTQENSGWAALNDAPIYRALQLIHARFDDDWTLEALANEVGLSRTAFATRFREKIGMTPMRYITTWRMQKAKELLETTNLPLMSIADRVGYGSEAALSRAFHRQFDQPPGAVRLTKDRSN